MSVKWNGDEFLAKVKAATDAAMTAVAISVERTIREGFGSNHGGVPSAPGEYPNSQTGGLRNSIGHTKAVDGVAYVGTPLDYGRYLNDGAIIRPKNRKHLAIPMSKQAKLAMEKSKTAADAISAMGCKARRRLKDGTGWVLGFQRKRKGFEAHWLISSKPRVIAPRPWGTLALKDANIGARFNHEFARAMARKGAA